jgi:hypothetical protein
MPSLSARRWILALRSSRRFLKRDVYISATKGAVLAYNNRISFPGWLSDALCVVTEGSSNSRRELYSDDEESIIFARAPAMLTAVANIVAKGDLSQRALYAGLAPVPDSERKGEPELWAQFESARLTGLSGGLGRLPTTKVTLPRMATFAKFVTACETAFWPEGTFPRRLGCQSAVCRPPVVALSPSRAPDSRQ